MDADDVDPVPAQPEVGAPAELAKAAEVAAPDGVPQPAEVAQPGEVVGPGEVVAPGEVAQPAEQAALPELVELALASIELSPEGLLPATGTVRLVGVAGGGHLEIVMARADAVLVQEALSGTAAPRPRTHDLLLSAVAALSGAVTGVALVERRPGGVYVANLQVLRPDGSIAELDARPSDALNVALRASGAALRAARALVDVPAN